MAAIIEAISLTGQTIYATVHNSAGNLANGVGTEVYNGSNWSTYVNALTEQGNTGYYSGTFPSYLPAGKYTIVLYQRPGGSPTLGDPVIGSGQIYWNGTVEEQGVGIVLTNTTLDLSSSTVGTVNTLSAGALATILTQIRTALTSDVIAELTGIPAATPTLTQAIMTLYMSLRNNHTATSTQEKIYNNAGSAIATSSVSDDGTTYTKGKFS